MTAGDVPLETLASRLRAQTGEGRYPEARAALAEYCAALRKTVGALRPGDPAVARLECECLRLLDETRRRVLAGRAHAAARLVRLPRLPVQYGEPSLPRHTLHCSG